MPARPSPRPDPDLVAPGTAEPAVRAAAVVGALSLATDLGTGQPLEHAMRTALLAVRLGGLAGVAQEVLRDTYYVALLHSAGCTSDGHEQLQVYGDDISARAAFALVDPGDMDAVVAFLRAYVGRGRPADVQAAMVQGALEHGVEGARTMFAMHCEVAQRFAGWLGFGDSVMAALPHVFERWDGQGFPAVTGGADIPLATRLVHVARDLSVFLTATGPEEARAVIARRSGGAYEPRLAALAVDHLDELLAGLDPTRCWEQTLDAEPAPVAWLAGERLDTAFEAMAAFIGLKSPWFRTHSFAVAEVAEAAAWRMGLPERAVDTVRRAALAHDLGRAGVSNAVWEKAGPLTFGEWEAVRSHPHLGERLFARCAGLEAVARMAGAHHELLDGSGYQRGLSGASLDTGARIVAAADHWIAMREGRPYRPALSAAEATAQLQADAAAGRLDPDAVDAVLASAGRRVEPRVRALPAGLSERELEVLRLLVRGDRNADMAAALGLSAKTIEHHIQHIYDKAGVHSRAAATVWAFEHHLVRT